jgi:hypothetical protein
LNKWLTKRWTCPIFRYAQNRQVSYVVSFQAKNPALFDGFKQRLQITLQLIFCLPKAASKLNAPPPQAALPELLMSDEKWGRHFWKLAGKGSFDCMAGGVILIADFLLFLLLCLYFFSN